MTSWSGVACGGRAGLILYRTLLAPGQLQGAANLSLGGPVHDYAQVPTQRVECHKFTMWRLMLSLDFTYVFRSHF